MTALTSQDRLVRQSQTVMIRDRQDEASQNYRLCEGAAHPAPRHWNSIRITFRQSATPPRTCFDWAPNRKVGHFAREVQKEDGYDVQAYNLASLRDKMSEFATPYNDDFVLRMSRHEAVVYGPQVSSCFVKPGAIFARIWVGAKASTTVEISLSKKDFAVRHVWNVRAIQDISESASGAYHGNSPASQVRHPVNWQRSSWHDFVTSSPWQMTGNKMPRW